MLRKLLFLLLRLTTVPFIARETIQRNRVTILCYHKPTPEVADRHFRILTTKYNIISLKQYVDLRKCRSDKKLPTKALVLTFDDGHKSNYTLKSVLKKYQIPATFFLCSGIVNTRRHYWWTVPMRKTDIEKLKVIPDEQRLQRLSELGFQEKKEYEDRQSLSKQEIEELKSIVDLQSHTRFHRILPQCSPELARDEILGSKNELENAFGLSIYALAYPNGNYSARETEMAKRSGYQCALTTDVGFNSLDTDMYGLKRLGIYDRADVNELIVKASGFWGFLERIFRRRSHRNVRLPS